MMAPEYRHRCIVWGVQPQYVIDMLNWMVHCWGIVPLTDMLSMVISKGDRRGGHPENREQAYYDMAYLTGEHDNAQPHPRRVQGAGG